MHRLGRTALIGAMAVAGTAGMRRPTRSPEPLARYVASQLHCAVFRETSRSDLETYLAGRTRRETLGLDGEWRFLAGAGADDSIRVEGWFDSLSVWRRSPDDSLAPDTDPLIGGRYRGMLSADGHYRADVRPFVPDEIAEAADPSRELDDLLPRLPLEALAVGETWTDRAGLEIRRLGDSTGADSVLRFRVTVRREAREATLRGDSLPLRLRQRTREDGTFTWHIRRGLLRRERHISVETTVPIEPRVRRPVRSKVEQQITLDRMPNRCE